MQKPWIRKTFTNIKYTLSITFRTSTIHFHTRSSSCKPVFLLTGSNFNFAAGYM